MAAPVVLAQAALLGMGDLAASPRLTVGLLAAAGVAWWISARRLQSLRDAVPVLWVAVILRLLALPLDATLSDDTLRYVWDGRVVTAGFDPYALAPDDERLEALRDERWRRMPHKTVPTVYPPLALGVFAAAAATPAPFWMLKSLLAVADLFAVWLLVRMAKAIGLPPGRAIGYAWCPLPVLEGAGMGHVDLLMVPLLVAAGLFLVRLVSEGPAGAPSRSVLAPAAAATAAVGAVLSKLVPLVALPLWWRLAAGRSARAGAVFAVTVAIGLLVGLGPIVARFAGPPPGLVTYGVSWEFNGPLYEPLARAYDRLAVDEWVHRAIDRRKAAEYAALERAKADGGSASPTDPDSWNRLYPFVYPQLLAKATLAAGFGAWLLWLLWRPAPRSTPAGATVLVATGRLFAGLLLAMATVYPWYLLWILPWAALCRHRGWLLAAGTVLLSYLPQHDAAIELFPWIWALVWLPPLVWMGLRPWELEPVAEPERPEPRPIP